MKQKYILYILFSLLTTFSSFAQEKKINSNKREGIEGLQIYPNPVTNGRIFITTDQNSNAKEIEIYDMLGKKVLTTTLNSTTKEINISNLTAGVYMIKISENNSSATRKLVVK